MAATSRRRILARTRLDFWLDALMLVAYTLAYSLGFTAIAPDDLEHRDAEGIRGRLR